MIRTVCVVDAETRQRNHDNAVSLGHPWLTAHPSRPEPLGVVGGGRSAREYLEEIRSWPGPLMAINGAYDWLLGHGIVARYVLCLDPLPEMVGLFPRRAPETEWIVATCCVPELFAILENVTIYKARQGDEPAQPGDIPGGCTAMTRAPLVGAVLGYRRVVLFGADSCYFDQASHVYGGALPDGLISVNGWVTTLGFLAQAEYLAEMVPAMMPVRVEIRGRNLASDLLNEKTEA